jgi:hypothetical protein
MGMPATMPTMPAMQTEAVTTAGGMAMTVTTEVAAKTEMAQNKTTTTVRRSLFADKPAKRVNHQPPRSGAIEHPIQ